MCIEFEMNGLTLTNAFVMTPGLRHLYKTTNYKQLFDDYILKVRYQFLSKHFPVFHSNDKAEKISAYLQRLRGTVWQRLHSLKKRLYMDGKNRLCMGEEKQTPRARKKQALHGRKKTFTWAEKTYAARSEK